MSEVKKLDIVQLNAKLQYVKNHTPERETVELQVGVLDELLQRVIYAETELKLI